jgi:hypothetical protein
MIINICSSVIMVPFILDMNMIMMMVKILINEIAIWWYRWYVSHMNCHYCIFVCCRFNIRRTHGTITSSLAQTCVNILWHCNLNISIAFTVDTVVTIVINNSCFHFFFSFCLMKLLQSNNILIFYKLSDLKCKHDGIFWTAWSRAVLTVKIMTTVTTTMKLMTCRCTQEVFISIWTTSHATWRTDVIVNMDIILIVVVWMTVLCRRT